VQRIMLKGTADGDNAVLDYYPAYYTENEARVKAVNDPDDIQQGVQQTEALQTQGKTYYNLQGMRVGKASKGLTVEVNTLSDGRRVSKKVKI
jgi:hypothetical protein